MASRQDGLERGGRVRVERGIYRQPNGKYAVCFMLDGKPRFRTVGYDLDSARAHRLTFVDAARWGAIAAAPRLRFDTVVEWWVGRFARRVASGQRRERTLELQRYHLDRHLLPLLGPRLIRQITTADVAELLDGVREQGCSEKTVAGALATLGSVMGFAVRNGWIADNPSPGSNATSARTRPVASSGYSAARRSPGCWMRACRPTGR